MAKPVKITETVLRDAHQSLIATRMTTAEMLPIVEKLDEVGYHSLEAWGGATFDSCLRFLNEDPWERLRKIKDKAKKTPLQMLFRGQNILGYRHYADDVVEYFVQKSIANGIDILRIFDALNDVKNLECAINACKKEKGHVQATVCYTISPVHTIETFTKMAKQLEDMGYANCPICVAKTQYSLTDDQTKLGAPTDFEVTVRNLKISAGAGFIVALTGEIMTMPGLPKRPAAERIDVDETGKITGLF